MGVVRAFKRPEPQPVAVLQKAVLPPLKWAGGKRWQVPIIEVYWDLFRHRRLVEPFAGGLAVAFGLRPERALLNDINPHVINFYQWLKKGLTISFEMANDERKYYAARERFNELLSTGQGNSEEAAGLFYYLNRTGYNGLCRFNSKGRFNVPFGSYRNINYRTDFHEYREVFRGWMFTCMDFEQLELDPTDFVYADPPYDVEFTQYSNGGFGWDDQERTAEWLANHKGPVILVNQATPRIVKLYQALKYNVAFHEAPRRISCTGDRTPAPEVFAFRNLK